MNPDRPLCPSARPEVEDSVVLGIIRNLGGEEFVHHLAEPLPVTPEILALAAPARPTEVFRFAAPCAGNGCSHFDGTDCRLVEKMVAAVSRTVDALPPCRIRPSCRWYTQVGKPACLRCPLIFSETANPSPELIYAADPAQYAR